MNKAREENKMRVMMKRLLCEFNLYWKFMCTDKNNDKNKKKLPHPPPTFTPVTVFFIAQKLLRL